MIVFKYNISLFNWGIVGQGASKYYCRNLVFAVKTKIFQPVEQLLLVLHPHLLQPRQLICRRWQSKQISFSRRHNRRFFSQASVHFQRVLACIWSGSHQLRHLRAQLHDNCFNKVGFCIRRGVRKMLHEIDATISNKLYLLSSSHVNLACSK